jgi:MFS family permease
MFGVALAQGGILTFLPIYAMQRGITDAGSFFLVYAGALIMTRLYAGKIVDRFGTLVTLMPGIVLVILGLTILAYAGTLAWFWGAAILYGFGYGIVQPLLNAVAVRMSPDSCCGAANAVFHSALDIGVGLGSVFWGRVAQEAGFTVVYLAAAGCAGIALFVGLILLKR